GDTVLLHLVRANPFFEAVAEQATVVLSVAGDWAYVPSDWKTIGDEDPTLGIPTTYYGAVQLTGRASVVDDAELVAGVLSRQMEVLQPGIVVADPYDAHRDKLAAIRAVSVAIEEVRAKFKYGGNVDVAHRQTVAERLAVRSNPGDEAAAGHLRRRLTTE
ncbi:MAG: FMN-binding negative transcriptional regulator, partial [Actinomycetota bacterium]|nr:FMN-binding negative transcriptional regulator [Actinomycetota bacterium]